ncbi:MAG: glycosyltransferase family 2 protein [Candidatus Omnitrophica bacterium]|nr:glycosyltransferase family 2 protein [Candidatus Omnitrophota bacterium]MCB9746950.1 glycosyltransferase family 2 protein [Candidatus Omnitrophota bacterium]
MNSRNIDMSIVIPTFNNCEELRYLLESLIEQKGVDDLNYEIIVINNNSKDQTVEVVESFIPRFSGKLKMVFEENQGISFARNRGVKESAGEIIAFTDSDCVVEDHWISEIILAYKKYNADAIQGKVILATPIPREIWYPEEFIQQRLAHVDYGEKVIVFDKEDLVTANASFRRELFDKFGGFSSSITYKASEDTEFSLRIAKTGVKRIYVPSIKVFHHFALERLEEAKLIRQSYYWGRAAILSDKIGTSYGRYFLYCLKRLVVLYGTLIKHYIKYDHKKVFFTKCKINTYRGRCIQLLANCFRKNKNG